MAITILPTFIVITSLFHPFTARLLARYFIADQTILAQKIVSAAYVINSGAALSGKEISRACTSALSRRRSLRPRGSLNRFGPADQGLKSSVLWSHSLFG
jgi:hypothetical protein